MRIGLAKPAS
ncbi:hypothetical protein E2C01_051750 [Portunus trituberculatus]|uniref:Uncharacterized protein n=1 Tax=Portunus trituberculatus TaxID=210409 RepID=A0A5B7GJW9_PORTR|nr:hypothetical protein [Portunus trituberculatus]